MRYDSILASETSRETEASVPTYIVAILGVDGSGKSTMIAELQRREVLKGAAYVKNSTKRADMLFRRFYPAGPTGVPDYIKGNFATIRPFAVGIDVIENYENTIRPLIGRVPYLVIDRYFLSTIAYFRMFGHAQIAEEYFSSLRHADLTVYLRVDPSVLPERYERRGGAHESEAIELITWHCHAIDEVVAEMRDRGLRIITVDNSSAPFEVTYPIVERIILEHTTAAAAAASR